MHVGLRAAPVNVGWHCGHPRATLRAGPNRCWGTPQGTRRLDTRNGMAHHPSKPCTLPCSLSEP
eukprot:11202498-Lingulodinium_polyedra.AAC.1